jgi:hypothetical protein
MSGPTVASVGDGWNRRLRESWSSQRATKFDRRGNRSANSSMGRTVSAKVKATAVVTSAWLIFGVPAIHPPTSISDAAKFRCSKPPRTWFSLCSIQGAWTFSAGLKRPS